MSLRTLLTAAAFAAAAAAPAFAQTPQEKGMRQEVIQACGPDIRALCGSVTPGQGRLKSCLRQNMRRLSPHCKGELVEAHAARQQEEQQQKPY